MSTDIIVPTGTYFQNEISLEEPCCITEDDLSALSGEEFRIPFRPRPRGPINTDAIAWAAALFDPLDILEFRLLPPKSLPETLAPREFILSKTLRQSDFFAWALADEIPAVAEQLAIMNLGATTWWGLWGQTTKHWHETTTVGNVPLNVYCSANPRSRFWGKKSRDVWLARSLFVDLENITVQGGLELVATAGFPKPTVIVNSGHGVHLYWRLNEPCFDLGRWTRTQKQLIQVFGADPSIHDPARMMRLPGFINQNGTPAPCRLIEADGDRRFGLGDLDALLPQPPAPQLRREAVSVTGKSVKPPVAVTSQIMRRAMAYQEAFAPAKPGTRNSKVFDLAANLVEKFDLEFDATLAVCQEYNNRCPEPLDDGEVEAVVNNAHQHVIGKNQPRGDTAHFRQIDKAASAQVISLEIWRQKMLEARIESLNESGTIFFDGSTTGAGKTTADEAAMRKAGNSVTFLPTHDACQELASALSQKGLDVAAHPPLNEDTCQLFGSKMRPGVAQIVQNAGLNVGSAVCPNCEFAKNCIYQQRREKARTATHAIATHARAGLSGFQPAENKAVAFIHEDPISLLRPMAKIVRFSMKSTVAQSRHLQDIVEIAKMAEQIAETWDDQPLLQFAKTLQATTNDLIRQLESRELVGPLEEAVRGGTSTNSLPTVKQITLRPQLVRPANLDVLLRRAMSTFGRFANGAALKLAVSYAVGELDCLCALVDESFGKNNPGQKATRCFSNALLGTWKVQPPENMVVWFEDASSDVELLTELLEATVIDKTPQGRLAFEVPPVQYADHDVTQRTSGKTIRGLIRGLLAKHPQAKKVGIITHRCHLAELKKLQQLWKSRIAKVEYYRSGKDRASNAWLNCDLILVVGTPRVPPIAVRDTLIRLGQMSEACQDGEFGQVLWGDPAIKGLGYARASWAKVNRLMVRETLMQAVGRGRGVNQHGVPVVVVSNEPLALPLAISPLRPLSDTEDDTLHHVLSVTTHNAKYISLGKGVVTAVTTAEVASRSPHQQVILRKHLSSLYSHGLLRKKGERKGWLVEDWLVAGVIPTIKSEAR